MAIKYAIIHFFTGGNMLKFIKRAAIMAGCFLLTSLVCSAQSEPKKGIKVITNNWTSQIVLSRVTGEVFKRMGYPVKYLPSSISDQWGALSHGVGDVQVEVWEGTMADMFNRMVKDQRIVDAGAHSAVTREEWWYPDYVEEVCPGLPDWQALKECSSKFQTDFSAPFGTYYSGPWEKPDAARIRALVLDFKVKVLKNGDELWEVLKAADKIKKPVILFNWTPNWVESVYAGKFVEFPDYEPDCETNPSWGLNKAFTHDCGNPKGGWLKKAASNQFADSNSCAFRSLKLINFTNLQIASAAALVDVEEMDYQQAAEAWIKANPEVLKDWIPKGCG
jgi:glycine betaine/proline transport system substrate-binding protein